MATKTRCCIGSDADLLSKIQMEEVAALLDKSKSKSPVEFVKPEEDLVKVGGTTPKRSVRISH